MLLDTHALPWAVEDNPRLSRRTMGVIGGPDHEKLVSIISAHEVCLKHALGKLPGGRSVSSLFVQRRLQR